MLPPKVHGLRLHTFAGGTFPAAVICPVKNRPKLLAASTTALYLKRQGIHNKENNEYRCATCKKERKIEQLLKHLKKCFPFSGLGL